MSVKMNFKLDHSKINQSNGSNDNQNIRKELEKCFSTKGIQTLKVYAPSHKYIKVLLQSEKLVDDIFKHNLFFSNKGFQPALTMALKTARTIFCYGFDPNLLATHDAEAIKQHLIDADWKVSSVYVLQSKRSMKIEFQCKTTANQFLKLKSINILGIRLESKHMEQEIDPSINMCYSCGVLDPGHTRDACPYPLCCLRCGYYGHAFYECQSIPNIPPTQYTEYHKSQAYCISCATANGHCSLNHRICPTKKDIIRKRILDVRATRHQIDTDNDKRSELSKQIAAELSNIDKWPQLTPNLNEHHTNNSLPMTAIITLALIEEVHQEGSFQGKLDKACVENSFPIFKYDINHDAAVMFVQNLCANPRLEPLVKPKARTPAYSLSQPVHVSGTRSHSLTLRSVRDREKHLASANDDADSESYNSDTSSRQKRQRTKSPTQSTILGQSNDMINRLEDQTYMINTNNLSEVSNTNEEIYVNDLLTLYETNNAELSATKRQVIEGLLKKAVDIDRNMKVNVNIIRVSEDFP